MVRQCELLSVNRSGLYYQPRGETALNLALMRLIDEQFLETPWYGARQMARHLRRQGHKVGRKRMRRLMGVMGLTPIYQPPRTTVPHPGHRVYPYLLRGLAIERADQVWCVDITYIPMHRGFLYLVAVIARRQPGLAKIDLQLLARRRFKGIVGGTVLRAAGRRSSNQRVPMMERSGVTPPEMSVRSFCSRLFQFTTSILISISGCACMKVCGPSARNRGRWPHCSRRR